MVRLTGTKPDQPRFTIIRSGSWLARDGPAVVIQPSIARVDAHWTRGSS